MTLTSNNEVVGVRTIAGRWRRRLSVGAVAGLLVGLLGLSLVVPAASADTAPVDEPNTPATVSGDPLPTVQINGIVWSQAVAGGKVYAGGQFTSARPAGAAPGTNETARANLLSYDLVSGQLDTSFNPNVNGRILAVAASPDGKRLYVGGGFTSVNGVARYRLAAFDTATGALISSWAPGANTVVAGIRATNSTVYVVGSFTNINNTARTGAAALDAKTGALLSFNPVLQGGYLARSVVVSPDESKVVIAGSFLTTNGSNNPGRGIAALDATTGASLPWAMNGVLRNAGTTSSMYSLASDGDSVYGSGYDFGGTKTDDDFEGSFRASWADGSLVWMEDCHGDTYSVTPFKGALYTAAHTHYCGNIGEFPQLDPWYLNHSLAFSKEPSTRTITPDRYGYRSFTGNVAGKLLHWYPIWGTGTASGIGQAGWSVTSSGDYLLYGGEFTSVNGVRQQGLVRFTTKESAPNKVGPSVQGGLYKIGALSYRAGEARLNWDANYDVDNATLTYALYRQGVAAPLYTTTANSTYWQRPKMSFVDKTVTAGQTYSYRVRVTDPFGNATVSDWTPVTVAAAGTSTTYDDAVMGDSPKYFWPLNEASGTAAYDWANGNDLTTVGSGITRGAAGQEVAGFATATTFPGTATQFAVSKTSEPGPQQFSIEAWFKTTSTDGGKIVGFGDSRTGSSNSYDRHIYLNGSGAVSFGVYPGAARTLTSGSGYNDGQWHHVVGTMGAGGISLFVDGKRTGTDPSVTSAQSYTGYWRVGGDTIGSWPNTGSGTYLSGTIADVAVYDSVLTRDQVDAHWAASGRTSNLPSAPADAYGKAVYDLNPTLYWRLGEASGTTANDSGRDGATGVYNTSGSNSIARGESGALAGVSNPSIRFTSSKNFFGLWNNRQTVISTRQYSNPTTYSIETWFKTTSSGGGKIVGFGNSNSNDANASSNYDRHVYMNGRGQLMFGTYNGSTNVITAPGTYNDGQWHYVVASQSADGMRLYLDGTLVGSNSVADAQNYSGYWRVGGDSGWDGDPLWVGAVDEVAVYGSALTSAQVSAHYQLGKAGAVDAPPTAEFSSIATDLSVAFDAGSSTDAEGPLTYAWSFGDNSTATGATPSHTYQAAGVYGVTLTVTDTAGQTASRTHSVTVAAPNQLPTAAFTATVDQLKVSVDAAASVDADGTIQSYAWNWGDGANTTGSTSSHTYDSPGAKTITLTVTDDRGGSAVLVRTVDAVAPPVPNAPPTAALSATVGSDGRTVSVDGSASTDNDGTISTYAWDWGDGTPAGSGVQSSHTFLSDGSYTITLSVVDDDGAAGSATKVVTVAAPAAEEIIAKDAFERTLTAGWGSADTGGAWTVSGGSAAFSVGGGQGTVTLSPGGTREARLSAVSSVSSVVDAEVSTDTASVGGTASATVIGRLVGSNAYSARVRFEPNGVVRLYLMRDESLLGGATYAMPGTYVVGQPIKVRLSVRGTGPTTLGAKIWPSGSAEPSAWQTQATDSTPVLQSAGAVSLKTAISSVSTVATTKVRFDNVKVITGNTPAPPAVEPAAPPAAPPVQPTPNVAPTAAFTAATTGLSVAVDAAGSVDSDGTISSYAWTFGDGATASGATAAHPYASAGTYTVGLTVTDDRGATATVTHDVVVQDPPPAPPAAAIAADSFERTVSGGWGSSDLGGAWTAVGGAASFGVGSGAGSVALSPGYTREVRLAEVSSTAVVLSAGVWSDVVPVGGAVSATMIGRQVGNSVYSARVRFEPGNIVRLYIMRDETLLGGAIYTMPEQYSAGARINVKLQVSGAGPTTVAAKIWAAASTEPADWQLQGTDSTAAMQAAGFVGIRSAVSSASTNASTNLSYDDFSVTALQ